MLDLLGAAIGAGSRILGGVLGQNAQEKAAERNIELQKEFAQNGIQWKVKDAQAAGVHPLYALGASTQSFAPVSVGSPLGDAISGMGQDLSRASTATATAGQRASSFTTAVSKASTELSLENQGLQNELLRSQIARLKAQTGPPMPTAEANPWGATIPGQETSIGAVNWANLVKEKPQETTPTAPGSPSQEPGPMPSVGYATTPTGYAPIPAKDYKDRAEDMGPLPWWWFLRNVVLPNTGFGHNPPSNVPLKEGEYWYYHPYQEYRIGKKGHWAW